MDLVNYLLASDFPPFVGNFLTYVWQNVFVDKSRFSTGKVIHKMPKNTSSDHNP